MAKRTGIQAELREEHCWQATEALASKMQLISSGASAGGSKFFMEVRKQCMHQKCFGLIGMANVARFVEAFLKI